MSKILDSLVSEAETATGAWWLKLIPYVVVVAVVAMAVGAAYHFGVKTEHQARVADVATLKQQQTAQLAAIDHANRDALAKLQAAEDAKEQKARDDMAALDAKHFMELKDANSKADAAVAAVRTGTLRVRNKFTCPAAVHSDAGTSRGAAQAASAPGLGDGTGERGLSGDDVQILLRIGERANGISEKLKACQAVITGYGVQP